MRELCVYEVGKLFQLRYTELPQSSPEKSRAARELLTECTFDEVNVFRLFQKRNRAVILEVGVMSFMYNTQRGGQLGQRM